MNPQESKRFKLFKQDVLKYYVIDINELYMLINRHTHTSKKFYFGFNGRLRYHRHWIKILEGMGILVAVPNRLQTWKVIERNI